MELKKGIGIKSFYTDKFGTITLCVLFRRNLCRGEAALNALLAQVFDSGCSDLFGVKKLNDFLETNGDIVYKSDIVKKGEEQIIELFAEFRPEYTEKVFDFLGKVINSPNITDTVTERKKKILYDIIRNKKSDKKNFARERCIELMCKDEPFSVSGDGYLGDLDNVDAEQLKKHCKKVVNTSRVEIVAVGAITDSNLTEYAEKYFCLGERDFFVKKAEWETEEKPKREVSEKSPVVQTKLCIGCRTGINPVGEQWYRAVVANELFGCSADSALFGTVREKEGLCYYINSMLYRYKGIMLVQAGVDYSSSKKAAELVEKALEDTKSGGFDRERVKKAANAVAQGFEAKKDYPGAMLDFYLGQVIAGDSEDIDQFIKGIKSVEAVDGVFDKTFVDMIYVLEGGKDVDEANS